MCFFHRIQDGGYTLILVSSQDWKEGIFTLLSVPIFCEGLVMGGNGGGVIFFSSNGEAKCYAMTQSIKGVYRLEKAVMSC